LRSHGSEGLFIYEKKRVEEIAISKVRRTANNRIGRKGGKRG